MSLIVQQADSHHVQGPLESNCIDLFQHGLLKKCIDLFQENVQQFPNLEFPQPRSEIVEDFSSDQFYACKICQDVISGVLDEDLKAIAGSRSLPFTLVNFKLPHIEVYIFEHNPSNSLQAMAKYLVKVYFPC